MSTKKNSNLEVEFRKIPSLQFLYEVSEDGRIVRNVKSKHHLVFEQDRGGYYRIGVNIKGKHIHKFVHSLVAECWLGPKPEDLETDHIDRNRKNNHYKNLRYVTREENHKNRVFSEEGKRRNGEIAKARYDNATDEGKEQIIRGMREAWENDDGTLRAKQIKAVKDSWNNASDEEKLRRITPMLKKEGKKKLHHFESKKACAEYLSIKTNIKLTTVTGRLNAKRRYIGGYEIFYTLG